jgi:hypothetical protein
MKTVHQTSLIDKTTTTNDQWQHHPTKTHHPSIQTPEAHPQPPLQPNPQTQTAETPILTLIPTRNQYPSPKKANQTPLPSPQPSNSTPQTTTTLPSIFSLPGTEHTNPNHNQQDQSNQLALPAGFSPTVFGLSPPPFLSETNLNIAPTPPSNPQYATFPFDAAHTGMSGTAGGTVLTPGAQSHTSGTQTTTGSEGGSLEKDPFLSLLEQLAENENSQGGPSELDFFLTGTGAIDRESEIVDDKNGNGVS